MSPRHGLAITLLTFLTLACARSQPALPAAQAQEAAIPRTVSRKDELVLEGLINDCCYRQEVVNVSLPVRCYANVSLKDIIVYVYPSDTWSRSPAAQALRDLLKADLARDIPTQFVQFPDWSWAKDYKITIVDRTTERH